jgi:hypothetical protein
MVEYIPCCTAPALHWGLLHATRLASREILFERNIKKRTGPALFVLYGAHHSCQSHPSYPAIHVTVHLFSSQTFVHFGLNKKITVAFRLLPVPDSKSRNIPEVVIVRRGAGGVLGIWRGWVSWVKGGANGVSLQATWEGGGRFLSQLEGAK